MCGIRKFMGTLWADERGISAIEYALLLAFVGGGIILAADYLGDAVADQMNDTANCIGSTAACTS